jgi:hypothetical protein
VKTRIDIEADSEEHAIEAAIDEFYAQFEETAHITRIMPKPKNVLKLVKEAPVVEEMNWDTNEVTLWLANEYALYMDFQTILSTTSNDEDAARQVSEMNIPNPKVDKDEVDWLRIVQEEREG